MVKHSGGKVGKAARQLVNKVLANPQNQMQQNSKKHQDKNTRRFYGEEGN